MKLRTLMLQALALILVVGQIMGLSGLAANASARNATNVSRQRRNASALLLTQPAGESALQKASATESAPILQGREAADYLKSRGLYDRLNSSIEEARYQIDRTPADLVTELASASHHPDGISPQAQSFSSPSDSADAYEATNPAQHLEAYFGSSQVMLQPSATDGAPSWRTNVRLRAYGYGSHMFSAGPGTAVVHGNRIDIQHPGSARFQRASSAANSLVQGARPYHGSAPASPPRREGSEAVNESKITPDLSMNGSLAALLPARREGYAFSGQAPSPSPRGYAAVPKLGRVESRLARPTQNGIDPPESSVLFPNVELRRSRKTEGRPSLPRRHSLPVVQAAEPRNGATEEVVADPISPKLQVPITESYVNTRDGLEQGFTVNQPPALKANRRNGSADAKDTTVRVALQVTGGLRPHLADAGQAVALRRTNGQIALRYDHLSAQDATERSLAAHLEVRGQEIALIVNAAGAVYPVTIDPMFTQVQKLTASDGVPLDEFGAAVAISGDTVVAGSFEKNNATGEAYVFNRNQGGADNWGQVQKFTASDAAPGSGFGISLGISGDTLVVGAVGANAIMGAAYIFERNQGGAENWGQVQKLTASDGVPDDAFGFAVAISGDTVVAGAFQHDAINGAAYVFERNQGGAENWGQVQELTTNDGILMDELGASVAICGDTILVGAPNQNDITGAIYVYERNQGGAENWGQTNRLTASDGAAEDAFGFSIGISADTVVSGAFNKNSGSGVAYVFERNHGGAGNWGQVQKLTTSDTGVGDFGFAVAISIDTIAVGAPASTTTAGKDAGVAYTFGRNQGGAENWGQVQKLTPSDAATDDAFGDAIGIDGDTIISGAPGKNSITGAAYTFNNTCGDWTQIREAAASDAAAGDTFGDDIAISDDTIVVGAYRKGTLTGAAYVFERNQGGADNWGQVQKLTASDAAASDAFGFSVGIGGDTVVVGALGKNSGTGAAYVFDRNQGGAENWGQVKKLTASDAAPNAGFGRSIAIDGDTVVVGAELRNAAYIFERNQGGAENWGQVTSVTGSDTISTDETGYSVGISGDTVVVGAPFNDSTGAAYIFERNQGGAESWGQVRKLTASDAAAGDQFGNSVGINDDTVIVGAGLHNSSTGEAYIYERNQGGAENWGQVKKLTASDAAKGDGFGVSVRVSIDTIAVGASGKNTFTGAAYIFGRNQGGAENWGQVQKLTAGDGVADDAFAFSIGISGETVVAGADGKPAGAGTGAAYIFNLECGTPPPPPPTFNVCLKNNTTGDFIQWNTTTGAYLFTHCGGNDPFTLSGIGTVGLTNGIETLKDVKPDRNISAGFNIGSLIGTAVVTVIPSPGLDTTYHINDTVPHAVCSCTD